MLKKDKFGKLCKEKMVDEISSMLDTKPNFVLTQYMGSSNSELEQVRRGLKSTAGEYLVVKNSILKVILKERKLESMSPLVESGVGISLSGDDIIATCKVLVNFSKDHEKFKIRAAVVDGKIIPADQVKVLASLPSREVLLAKAIGGMKAPITGFVMTLNGVIRKFVYTVDAIKTKKTAEGAQQTASA
jgi:large subunit ribosomal protein L10